MARGWSILSFVILEYHITAIARFSQGPRKIAAIHGLMQEVPPRIKIQFPTRTYLLVPPETGRGAMPPCHPLRTTFTGLPCDTLSLG